MRAQHDTDARPVFGVDIDGTLGQYHSHFRLFAQDWVGRPLGDHDKPYDYGVPFNEYLGLSKTVYRMVKLAYRRGGLKRSMPAYPHAREITRGMKDNGALIVICTTRPYNQHDGIESDTLEWLRRNRVQFDFIIQGERKYIDLSKRFGDRVVCVFDDLTEMCEQANRRKIEAIQVVHAGEGRASGSYWKTGAFGLQVAETVALDRLDKWRAVQ